MFDGMIQLILILLFIFTPIAFGSIEPWAFSLMELGILCIIVLWAVQHLFQNSPAGRSGREFGFRNLKSVIPPLEFPVLLLCLFLALIIFQMIPLPAGLARVLSPKAYELRDSLSIASGHSALLASRFALSFVPFATKVECFKWLALSGLFVLLLRWKGLGERYRAMEHVVFIIFLMGAFESLYGMFEFFSGRQHILYLKGIPFVTGTFVNRNYFAGYLLMAIPLSMGFLFFRESHRRGRFGGWRQRLSALDGKSALIAFGIIVMILGLLFSASRMGILSLLLSFSVISLLFREHRKAPRVSGASVLILTLAILWGVWIGLDTVISRFTLVFDDFKLRAAIWRNTFEILKDFPVVGSGLGTFGMVFPLYQSFHIRNVVTHAENDFLQLASEVGLVGIGLLLVLFSYLFFKAVSGIRSLSSLEPQRYIGIGALVGILALMFHSLVERNLQVPANAFLFTFLWGIVIRISADKGSR